MTLVELLVAMSVLAFISIMIFSAIDGMRRSREGVERISDRYREGRMAMSRMARELGSAYLSEHAPINMSLRVAKTIFKGGPGSPAARVDFNSFGHRRLQTNAHESDQMEVAYFGSPDPEKQGVVDLARRVSSRVDEKPEEGGRVDVLATDIDLFHLEYLDPLTGRWLEEWDSSSAMGQKGRLPLQVKMVLVLNDGLRGSIGGSRNKLRLVSKVTPRIQDVLTFALK
jgi:general secretion pathway protein J